MLKLIMHHIIKILFTACFQLPKVLFLWAIGCLAEEGKLKLDDKIVDYFPEKQPEAGTYQIHSNAHYP